VTKPLRIGLAGLGTVGGGVARVLISRADALAMRAGRRIVLTAASANVVRDKDLDLSSVSREDSPLALAARDDIDLVVELLGGHEGAALELVEDALSAKKHVVTANKALLAHHGGSLAALAEENGVALSFEAAVGGGIPIVKAMRESLIAFDVTELKGILNGTCNFILTQMESTGRAFPDVLAEAQELGYAEADPTLDVGGADTAHKLALLASLAFGTAPDLAAVSVTGIEHIKPADIAFAREFGCRIKLLGAARLNDGALEQRVHPAMVKAGTPLADLEGSFNAVVADLGEAGPYIFEGRGAGRGPTTSAVVADIVNIARGAIGPVFGRPASSLVRANPTPLEARQGRYYLRFQVLDAPGVMASISRRLADAGISIDSMHQPNRPPGEPVAIAMITHEAQHVAVRRALKAIAASDNLFEEPCMIPMENT
jgi:homoserine dehydrogenase